MVRDAIERSMVTVTRNFMWLNMAKKFGNRLMMDMIQEVERKNGRSKSGKLGEHVRLSKSAWFYIRDGRHPSSSKSMQTLITLHGSTTRLVEGISLLPSTEWPRWSKRLRVHIQRLDQGLICAASERLQPRWQHWKQRRLRQTLQYESLANIFILILRSVQTLTLTVNETKGGPAIVETLLKSLSMPNYNKIILIFWTIWLEKQTLKPITPDQKLV